METFLTVDVFLLDDGCSLAIPVDTLRPQTVCVHGEEPGLVVIAGLSGLAGLVPAGEQWSDQLLGAARLL